MEFTVLEKSDVNLVRNVTCTLVLMDRQSPTLLPLILGHMQLREPVAVQQREGGLAVLP